MPTSVVHEGKVWDVMVKRDKTKTLAPVYLVRYDRDTGVRHKMLLCQVLNTGRFGWTVVVTSGVRLPPGVGLVEGFKQRWQAIRYAINVDPRLRSPDVQEQ